MDIGDADLEHLAQVQRSLSDLAGRLSGAVQAGDGATGTDAAGVVEVVLDSSGRVRQVTVAQGWRRLVGAPGLSAAVVEAGRAAGAECTRRVNEATSAAAASGGVSRARGARAADTSAGTVQASADAASPVPAHPAVTEVSGIAGSSGRAGSAGELRSLREVIDAVRELRAELTEVQDADDAAEAGVVGRDPAGRVEAQVAQGALQQVTLIGDWFTGASDKSVSLAVTAAVRAAYTASDQTGPRGILNRRAYRELSAVLSDPQRLASLFTPPARRNPS